MENRIESICTYTNLGRPTDRDWDWNFIFPLPHIGHWYISFCDLVIFDVICEEKLRYRKMFDQIVWPLRKRQHSSHSGIAPLTLRVCTRVVVTAMIWFTWPWESFTDQVRTCAECSLPSLPWSPACMLGSSPQLPGKWKEFQAPLASSKHKWSGPCGSLHELQLAAAPDQDILMSYYYWTDQIYSVVTSGYGSYG